MNRRDFLNPRRLAKTAVDVFDTVHQLTSLDVDSADTPRELSLLQYSREAMATTFELFLPLGVDHSLEAADEALDEIDRLEEQLSVYRDTSEVSRLNQQAAHEAVVVEDGLFDLLMLADELRQDTDGAFDVTSNGLSECWGFSRRAGRVPTLEERHAALTRVGMDKVVLNPESKSIRFLRDGITINLGSIGKGYALDQAALVLRQRWRMPCALLHGGHSSVYGLGNEPGSRDGWPVGIRHPWQPERRVAIVRLKYQGLGTSAATFQHLDYNGQRLGHILDPRTGWPASGLASASVVAPTASQADALATAFFILGIEKTQAYCAAHPEIGALLLPEEDKARPVIVGLSPEQITLA